MGEWDEFCLVCGGPPNAPDVADLVEVAKAEGKSEEAQEALRAGLTGLEWLGSYVGVLGNEELIPLGQYSYGGFDSLDDSRYERPISAADFELQYVQTDWDKEDNKDLTLTCHEKCYKLLQTELGYTLRFQDVWPMLMEQVQISNSYTVGERSGTDGSSPKPWNDSIALNSFRWTSYGGMGVYQGQFFLFEQAVTDGNSWMLQDPTITERNATRIVKVWRPLLENGFKVPPESLESKFVDLGLLR